MRRARLPHVALLSLTSDALAGHSSVHESPVTPAACTPGSPSAALLIGVDDYASPEVPDLRQTGAEVALVAQALTRTASYPERAVTVLRSQGDAAHQPTTANARAALDALAAGGPYGTVLVYVSGFADPSEGGLRFLTSDAAPSSPASGGLDIGALTAALAALPACHAALVLDAGPRAPRGVTATSLRLGLAPGVPMLSSARWDQIPLEAPASSISFASLFAEGLEGPADLAPRDGVMTLGELLAYTEQGMAAAGIRHTPTLSCLDCGSSWPPVATARPGR